jgi:CheY-like chemotaxis protein/HPt (histidine-containing phosphotransfer) domain-containing protein
MFYPGRQPDSATDLSVLQTQSLNLYQANQELQRLNARLEQRLHDHTAALEAAVTDSDKFNINCMPFDLHAVIDQTVALWQPHAQARHLQLTHDIDSHTPAWLYGDPVRLNQVLANLISNALKFTRQGRINLSVDSIELTSADTDRSVMLRITVQDSGIGMTPELQRHVFNLFAQADGIATSTVAGGPGSDAGLISGLTSGLISGLGLSICKQLVVLMGGEISVDSVPGQGTCFTLAIPCQACQSHIDSVSQTPEHGAASPTSKHILVVDDNEINRSVAASMLERLGYTVSLAVNGQQAITAVQHGQFDLVLMDYHMPLLDGVDATKAIRAWEQTNRRTAMPIIAVSASAFQDDRDRYAAAGMNDFVPKPITLASLNAALQKWLAAATTHITSDLADADDTLARLPEELFSRAQFSEMFSLAGPRFCELLCRFGEDADRQLEAMRTAALMQDADSVRRCAHKLKGSASSIGAYALASCCERVEQQARNQQLQHIMVDIDGINACYQRCRPILDTYLDQ